MTSKQRAYLKSLASSLEPIFQIGKGSLTPEVTEAISEAFNNRELIKIAVLKNCFDDPNEIAATVAERTKSQVVQVIGKKSSFTRKARIIKRSSFPNSKRKNCLNGGSLMNTGKDQESHSLEGEKRHRRVGIMGGTFNPVHMGHLLLAENAYSMFSLDEILFIPSGCSYMKDQTEILDGCHKAAYDAAVHCG